MTTFMIKHKSGGKFIHPLGGLPNPAEQTKIILFDGYHDNTVWEFEIHEKEWGYIKHVASGKYLHPDGGFLVPESDHKIVMHSGKHAACLFAIDEVKHVIVHRGSGNYLHPAGGQSAPDNNTEFVLHPGIHLGMQLQFVEPDGTTEAYPYGKPTVAGHWKIIHMVKNPLALHRDIISVTVGKSATESSTSSTETSVTYKWEAHGGVGIDAFNFGGSQSVQASVKLAWSNTSSHTWKEETTRTREIAVAKGTTVVVWQFCFAVTQQNSTRVCYNSSFLADTNSESTVPDDLSSATSV